MLLGNIGSFMGTVEKNVNMLNVFAEDIKKKDPSWNIYKDFYRIHQLSDYSAIKAA